MTTYTKFNINDDALLYCHYEFKRKEARHFDKLKPWGRPSVICKSCLQKGATIDKMFGSNGQYLPEFKKLKDEAEKREKQEELENEIYK